MCDLHDDDEDHEPPRHVLSRRRLLGLGAAAVAGASIVDSLWLPGTAMAASGTQDTLTGRAPTRLAMHVHGSWSEGPGSWEAQFDQAARHGVDVLYMTDHDIRQVARHYMTSLREANWIKSSAGKLHREAASTSGGSIHVLAESASRARAASVTMTIKNSRRRLRTSVAGHTLVHKVSSAWLTHGAKYEIVVSLSYHPAASGRPAGQFQLVYRFGAFTHRRFTEASGLRGVVTMPTPTAGSVQRLQPERDIAQIWPTMHPADNCLHDVAFVAHSPHRGAVANVRVGSLTFERTKNTAAAVTQAQLDIIARYGSRFPTLDVRPSSEFSRQLPDLSGFGTPQYIPDYDLLSDDVPTAYRQIVAEVQGQGGLVSWNHPFGYDARPLISADAQVAKRRQTYQTMTDLGVYGVDILEVGYVQRGECNAATHLDLWDTFSRASHFLTGNGVTDDHNGQSWSSLFNGFGTGVWSDSRSDADVGTALSGGRAFLHHMGRWPGGAMDLQVDGRAGMGSVWVGGTTAGGAVSSRRLTVLADALPSGSVVQVVRGPVDQSGSVDPGTQVVLARPAADFAAGPVDISIDARDASFYRVQVLASDGGFIGTSNPVWLLDSEPDGGVPASRQVS